jgi:hypothetical protein
MSEQQARVSPRLLLFKNIPITLTHKKMIFKTKLSICEVLGSLLVLGVIVSSYGKKKVVFSFLVWGGSDETVSKYRRAKKPEKNAFGADRYFRTFAYYFNNNGFSLYGSKWSGYISTKK